MMATSRSVTRWLPVCAKPCAAISIFLLIIFLLLRTKLEVEEKEEEQRKLEAARVAEVNANRLNGHSSFAKAQDGAIFEYNSQDHPLIFIGGHPRSGTTLLRAMLDSHPMVRCGEETRTIPRILQLRTNWYATDNEIHRLAQGGVTKSVIDSAIAAFVLETIVRHADPAEVLCNKDPLSLRHGAYLTSIFPRSRWIFMVRDGRAVVHSVISRKITITGYDHDNPRECLQRWNNVVFVMDKVCNKLGDSRCLRVQYEQLVLHPRAELVRLLDWLHLPWDEAVLSHHQKINKPGGVRVSISERSSDQVVRPVNTGALTAWVGTFPKDVLSEMADLAPMLKTLGYDPNDNHPTYGQADPEVLENNRELEEKAGFWAVRGAQLLKEMVKPESDLEDVEEAEDES